MSKIVSIDGGGTKTLAVLYDENGQELQRVIKGSSNFAVHVEEALNTLKAALDEIINKDVLSIHIGLSGYSMVPNKDNLIKDLEKAYHTRVFIYPDAHLGLYSAYDANNPLIYVVGGTGSIMYSLVDGQMKRYGGYGHLFGDPGSAYSFVMDIFKDCLHQLDYGKPLNEVQHSLLKDLNLTTNEDIIGYTHRVKKQDIAKLARNITNHQHPYVLEKIQVQANLIAQSIMEVSQSIDISKQWMIALRGGFLEAAPNLKNEVLNILNINKVNYILNRDIKEAVYGGYILSKLSKGKE